MLLIFVLFPVLKKIDTATLHPGEFCQVSPDDPPAESLSPAHSQSCIFSCRIHASPKHCTVQYGARCTIAIVLFSHQHICYSCFSQTHEQHSFSFSDAHSIDCHFSDFVSIRSLSLSIDFLFARFRNIPRISTVANKRNHCLFHPR